MLSATPSAHRPVDPGLVLDALAGAVVCTAADGLITFWNPAAERLYGYAAAEVLGRPAALLQPAEERSAHPDALASPEREAWHVGKSGKRICVRLCAAPLRDGAGRTIGEVVQATDITESKHIEQRLQHLALHDALTGLSNRTLLFDRLNSALAAASRRKSAFALFFLDLDNFKPINDELGHDAGDIALKVIAGRLQDGVRNSDTVARIGGDEFVLVLQDVHGRDAAMTVAGKTIARLSESIDIDSHRYEVGASLGIALYPEHGENVDLLMRHADAAMYTAKRLGKNRSVIWQN